MSKTIRIVSAATALALTLTSIGLVSLTAAEETRGLWVYDEASKSFSYTASATENIADNFSLGINDFTDTEGNRLEYGFEGEIAKISFNVAAEGTEDGNNFTLAMFDGDENQVTMSCDFPADNGGTKKELVFEQGWNGSAWSWGWLDEGATVTLSDIKITDKSGSEYNYAAKFAIVSGTETAEFKPGEAAPQTVELSDWYDEPYHYGQLFFYGHDWNMGTYRVKDFAEQYGKINVKFNVSDIVGEIFVRLIITDKSGFDAFISDPIRLEDGAASFDFDLGDKLKYMDGEIGYMVLQAYSEAENAAFDIVSADVRSAEVTGTEVYEKAASIQERIYVDEYDGKYHVSVNLEDFPEGCSLTDFAAKYGSVKVTFAPINVPDNANLTARVVLATTDDNGDYGGSIVLVGEASAEEGADNVLRADISGERLNYIYNALSAVVLEFTSDVDLAETGFNVAPNAEKTFTVTGADTLSVNLGANETIYIESYTWGDNEGYNMNNGWVNVLSPDFYPTHPQLVKDLLGQYNKVNVKFDANNFTGKYKDNIRYYIAIIDNETNLGITLYDDVLIEGTNEAEINFEGTYPLYADDKYIVGIIFYVESRDFHTDTDQEILASFDLSTPAVDVRGTEEFKFEFNNQSLNTVVMNNPDGGMWFEDNTVLSVAEIPEDATFKSFVNTYDKFSYDFLISNLRVYDGFTPYFNITFRSKETNSFGEEAYVYAINLTPVGSDKLELPSNTEIKGTIDIDKFPDVEAGLRDIVLSFYLEWAEDPSKTGQMLRSLESGTPVLGFDIVPFVVATELNGGKATVAPSAEDLADENKVFEFVDESGEKVDPENVGLAIEDQVENGSADMDSIEESLNSAIESIDDIDRIDEIKNVYDITLKANGNEVQPDNFKVTVVIPLPDTISPEETQNICLMRVEAGGNFTKLTISYDPASHSISFTTEHFSQYVLAVAHTHVFDSDGKCTICGYEKPSAPGDETTAPSPVITVAPGAFSVPTAETSAAETTTPANTSSASSESEAASASAPSTETAAPNNGTSAPAEESAAPAENTESSGNSAADNTGSANSVGNEDKNVATGLTLAFIPSIAAAAGVIVSRKKK